MSTLILVVYVLVAVTLIGLILIQHGKGADAGATFGGGASDTVFGSQGSGNFLTKTTAILATAFFAIALFLSYLSGKTIKKEVSPVIAPKVEQQQSIDIPEIPDIPVMPKENQPAGNTTSVKADSNTSVPTAVEQQQNKPMMSSHSENKNTQTKTQSPQSSVSSDQENENNKSEIITPPQSQ